MMFKQKTISWAVASALLVVSGSAAASGFALYEHGSGLGNAFAGGAASAEDASTIYFNPAGMAQLSGKQVVLGAHAIRPSMKFNNVNSKPALFQTTLGDNGGDAGSWALVPTAHFAMELDPKWHLGIGIFSPFGLQTEYTPTWMGRFQAIKSKIQTVDLNPSVSYEVNDNLSVGAGVNYQHIKGDLSSAVNYSAAAGGRLGPNLEGISTVSGSDSAWGGNVGVLYKVSPATRIGAAYRSRIKYNLTGSVVFTNVPAPLAAAVPNGPVTLGISMPDSFSLSVFHQASDKCDVMADLTWTGWSVLQQLRIDRTNGTNLINVPENWRDTWRLAVGGNYRYTEQWKARVGVAYDQTPVSDVHRTARIPDAARFQVAFGGQYKVDKDSAWDFGYSHFFVNNASIVDQQNKPLSVPPKANGDLIGNYKNSVDILSVVYAHSF